MTYPVNILHIHGAAFQPGAYNTLANNQEEYQGIAGVVNTEYWQITGIGMSDQSNGNDSAFHYLFCSTIALSSEGGICYSVTCTFIRL